MPPQQPSQQPIYSVAITLICSCFVTLYLLPLSNAQTLHTTNAIHANAQLLKLESPDQWSFQLDEREIVITSSRIVRWGSWPGVRADQAVWLGDGSWLCGDVQFEHESIGVSSDWFKLLALPLNSVRGVVLSPPTTLPRWLVLQSQMLAASGEQDMVWLADGKKLNGIIRWPAANVELPFRTLTVDVSGQKVEVVLDEIQAIVFSPTLLGPLLPHQNTTQLGMVDGSLLWTKKIEPEVSSVAVTLGSAIKLMSLDGPLQFCKAIKFVASDRGIGQSAGVPAIGTATGTPANGTPANGTQLLSDLPVASYRHVTDSELKWELGINRDLYGRALHDLRGIYPQGLATHSSSQVAYRWDGSPGRLLAEVAMAASPPQGDSPLGSVKCQILLARGGQLESVESFSMTRFAIHETVITHMVDVDLSNAKLVVLVTDKADFGQYGDQVMWLDARLAVPQP